MSLRKSIVSFFALFVLFFFYFNVRGEKGQLEIVDLGQGVLAHKQVQDSMMVNHISTEDVIEAYKAAMPKREKEDSIIYEKRSKFAIYIDTEEKMIVSIAIRHHVREE